MSEADLIKAIIESLRQRGDVVVWRQNTGAAAIGSRFVRFGRPGCADISGMMVGTGRRVELEVKTPRGKISQHQAAFGELVADCGGVYAVVRSVEDANRVITEARN